MVFGNLFINVTVTDPGFVGASAQNAGECMDAQRHEEEPIMMKKQWMKAAAVLITAFALGGCSGASKQAETTTAASAAQTTAVESEAESTTEGESAGSELDVNDLGPVLQKIYDRGSVIVGNDSSYPPFGFIDTTTNQAIGVEKEMATAIAAKLSEKLGKEIKLDFQSMEFSAVLSSLSTGKIDLICSCLTVTDERKKVMDFSDPYLQTQDVCLILAKNKDQYQSLSDFKDKKLAANTGSSQEVRANSISSTVTSTPTVSDAILQLQAGKVDAIVVDNITAERYSVGSDDLYSFELSDDEVTPVDKAVGFQQGNDDLKAIVNEVVKEETESGNVEKWVTEYAKKAAEMGLNK